jgi:hypothetical protein
MIPIPEGYKIPEIVIDSIRAQSYSVDIVVFESPGKHGGSRQEIRDGNYLNCAKMKEYCKGISDDYVMYQDSDVVHIWGHTIENMVSRLNCNSEWGGVAVSNKYPTNLTQGHINSVCCVIRREFFVTAEFSRSKCQCTAIGEVIRKDGKIYGYLNEKKLVECLPR